MLMSTNRRYHVVLYRAFWAKKKIYAQVQYVFYTFHIKYVYNSLGNGVQLLRIVPIVCITYQ